ASSSASLHFPIAIPVRLRSSLTISMDTGLLIALPLLDNHFFDFQLLALFHPTNNGDAHIVFLIDDPLSELFDDQLNALQSIVVAGDHMVNRIGVAVGIDQSHDGDAEVTRLIDGNVLPIGVDENDETRDLLHCSNPLKVSLQLELELRLQGELLFG